MVCRATTLLQSIGCVAMENWEKICPKHRLVRLTEEDCDGTMTEIDCRCIPLAAVYFYAVATIRARW
jgi:hypothetical protein